MNKRLKYKLLPAFFLAANLGLTVYVWFGSSAGSFAQPSLAVISFGRLFGLLAANTVLLQFLLIGRALWLERLFGLDKLSLVHHWVGTFSAFFLISHPVLMVIGNSQFSGLSFFPQLIDLLKNHPYVLPGFIAMVIFLAVIASSLYIARLKLKYESWYFIHLAVFLATFLAFWHQINISTTLNSNRWFYVYWICLYAFVLGNHLIFRFLRQIWLFFRHKFTVNKVVAENYNTTSIYIRGNDLLKFGAKPGQFMIVRFLAPRFWWQAHPFSFSSPVSGSYIRITVKQVGDFTSRLNQLKPGVKVLIEGPFGKFTAEEVDKDKVLFIAGGIGITPIRALIESLAGEKDLVLLYATRSEKDIVFKQELEKLQEKNFFPWVKIFGKLDMVKLGGLVPALSEREVFLCGPPSMMKKAIADLQTLGLDKRQVHYEKFSLG